MNLRSKLVCADGFTVSVQASQYHYCTPREDDPEHGYISVEVGFPSVRPEPWEGTWEDLAENRDDPTGTVYGWVPVETVEALLESHGGIVAGQLPPTRVAG
jgi:hypothetical protein